MSIVVAMEEVHVSSQITCSVIGSPGTRCFDFYRCDVKSKTPCSWAAYGTVADQERITWSTCFLQELQYFTQPTSPSPSISCDGLKVLYWYFSQKQFYRESNVLQEIKPTAFNSLQQQFYELLNIHLSLAKIFVMPTSPGKITDLYSKIFLYWFTIFRENCTPR